jgi:predicted nucleic-acid-binding protein
MIAADSNLIVRHLTHDDASQAEEVRALFVTAELKQEPVFLSHLVLCEVCWVLKAVYGFEKAQITVGLQALLDDTCFVIQGRPLVDEALSLYRRHSGQFADHLIGVVAKREGANTTYTFDKGVGKFPNFTLLK